MPQETLQMQVMVLFLPMATQDCTLNQIYCHRLSLHTG